VGFGTALVRLCAYADAANVWLEVLVKDELDLPKPLPSKNKVKVLNGNRCFH
jgi:hypothetical protein